MQQDNLIQKITALISKPRRYVLFLSFAILLVILIASTFVFAYYKEIQKQNNDEITEVSNEEEIKDEDIPSATETETEQPTTETPPVVKPPVKEDPLPTPEPEPKPVPKPPESPSAVVAFYADTQSDTDAEDANHQRVVNYILNSGANPVFHAGDVMEDGTQASLDRFNSVTTTLRSSRTFYAALGNNDRKVGDSTTPSDLFLSNFSFPNNERWYSVNYGNLHLIVLDSAFAAGSTTQLNWLSADLQSANSQNRITGVMFHHPTFKTTIASQLINYGVDFVISGHTHAYSHTTSSGIHYFVLSGQPSIGYMVAKIYSNQVKITMYSSGNAVVESVTFNER